MAINPLGSIGVPPSLDGKATTLDARPLRASRFAENDLNPFTGLL